MVEAITNNNFIIIDDSKIDIFLVEKILQNAVPGCHIISFDQPDKALAFFTNHQPQIVYTVLLDINMPVISGFEFLAAFDKLPESHKKYYRIYILTSSQNVTDIQRGQANKNVFDVMHKPLKQDTLIHLLKKQD